MEDVMHVAYIKYTQSVPLKPQVSKPGESASECTTQAPGQ